MRSHQVFASMSPERAHEVMKALSEKAPAVFAQAVHAASIAMKARPVYLKRQPLEKRANAVRRALARVSANDVASEILAVTGQTPSERYRELTQRFGEPVYARIDVACSKDDKAKLGKLSATDVTATELAGDPITQRLTEAPGNGAAIGGLKVVTDGGWFAARPSGTEDVYKVYAESFRGAEHLARIQEEARDVVAAALNG